MIRPGGYLTVVIKNLIIINVLLFLATYLLGNGILLEKLSLYYPTSEKFEPYQFITYMFMHGGLMHILFNMLGLWMFGSDVESYWGPKRFLTYYVVCGLGAAALHFGIEYYRMAEITQQIEALGGIENIDHYPEIGNLLAYREAIENVPMLGASGAVFGVLLAYGMMFPNNIIMPLFPPIPMKAKYFVMIYGALELYSGIQNSATDNVAHFAHLGGLVTGIILILIWRRQGKLY